MPFNTEMRLLNCELRMFYFLLFRMLLAPICFIEETYSFLFLADDKALLAWLFGRAIFGILTELIAKDRLLVAEPFLIIAETC